MKHCIFLLFLLGVYAASAQPDLNLIFNLPDQNYTRISKLLVEEDTIVTIGNVIVTPGKYGIQFSKYDTLGNLLLYKTYYPEGDHDYTPGRFMGFIRTTQKNYLTITNVDLGQGIVVADP